MNDDVLPNMDWFSQPLHGVVCRPCSQHEPQHYELKLCQHAKINVLGKPIWQGKQQTERYSTQVSLYQHDNCYTLEIDCQGKGYFHLDGEQFGIDWSADGTPASHYFQSMGLALWLELQGVVCLHGNALTKGERTLVLVAPSGTGKSTLSSALLQRGYELLTDDMVALHRQAEEYLIYPSWPVMRLWPDSIENVLRESASHAKVHADFNKQIVPLQRSAQKNTQKNLTEILLLKREDRVANQSGVHIRTLRGTEAVMTLLKNTILGEVYRPLGIEQKRLSDLARLAGRVQVNELTYPSGTAGLQAITDWLA